MSRKRLDGSLHQGLPASPQGSPNTAGVIAPPPTPESISSLAVGKLIYDELDRIPEDRFTSLGDSRFAPTSQVSDFRYLDISSSKAIWNFQMPEKGKTC